VINLYDNEMNVVPKLPRVVSKVDLMKNRLAEYPSFPKTILNEFDIRDNPVVCDNDQMGEQIEAQLKHDHPKARILVMEYDDAGPGLFDAPPGLTDARGRPHGHNSGGYIDTTELAAYRKYLRNGESTRHDTSDGVKITTKTVDDQREESLQQAIKSQNLFNRNAGANSSGGSRGSGNRGRGRGNHGNYGRGKPFNNYFSQPTHDREKVRRMTDDGHRPSSKYKIFHQSIYRVN